MDKTKLYDELTKHLGQGVVGSPKSPALMKIIKVTRRDLTKMDVSFSSH
jgi:hypothetical protein